MSQSAFFVREDPETRTKSLCIGEHVVHTCSIDCDDLERTMADILRSSILEDAERKSAPVHRRIFRWIAASMALALVLTIIDIAFIFWHLDLAMDWGWFSFLPGHAEVDLAPVVELVDVLQEQGIEIPAELLEEIEGLAEAHDH